MTERLNETMLMLGDLVGFPTVTSEPNLGLIEYLVDRLDGVADIRLTHDETGQQANLLATIGPRVNDGVILSGHSDVVPADEPGWTGPPFLATRRDQHIFGRGTADMKGFIACAVAMARDFAAAPLKRPLHIAVTFDEEEGCRGAPLLIADLTAIGIKPAAAVVGEPTGMTLVTAHKGMHEYATTVTGMEGHASMPANGVNAVHYGARYVAGLLELGSLLKTRGSNDERYEPAHTTISVGTLKGGMARNVIASECVIEWEMRPVNQLDADLVAAEIEKLEKILTEEMRIVAPEASITTVTEGAVAGLVEVGESAAVKLVSDLLANPIRGTKSFGTEAGLYQFAGISAVVCGPGHIEVAHRPDESIGIDQLAACLEFLEGLIGKLCDD